MLKPDFYLFFLFLIYRSNNKCDYILHFQFVLELFSQPFALYLRGKVIRGRIPLGIRSLNPHFPHFIMFFGCGAVTWRTRVQRNREKQSLAL